MNVAIALLAALVLMPPLSVYVDEKGWLGTQNPVAGPTDSVRLAAAIPGPHTVGAAIGVVGFVAAGAAVYATADTSTGEASEIDYVAVPLPTTTTTTTTTIPTTTIPGEEPEVLDPNDFGTERPDSVVGGALFDLLTDEGVPPNQTNCTIETLNSRISDDDLLALGIITSEPAAIEFVVTAAQDCGIDDDTIDSALAAFAGG